MVLNGKKIEMAMARKMMKYQDLAKKADISKTTVDKAIRGGDLNPYTAGVIADALDVDIAELMEDGK